MHRTISSRTHAFASVLSPVDPTKSETLEYIRAAMGIRVISTYGRTETSGIATSCSMFDYSSMPQHVGAPVGCNEIKLVDDAESGFISADEPNPRGEVCERTQE